MQSYGTWRRSRNGSQIREKVKEKKAESGESQQGEGRENAQARYARNG